VKGGAGRESFDLYTWGHGGQGALGNSAFRDELEPFLVSALRAHGGTILVACGFDHTVAVTGDLKASAWGRAAEGQLRLESTDGVLESPRGGGCVLTPTLVGLCEGDAPAAVQAVSCGGMHTLLLSMPRSSQARPDKTRDRPVAFACGRGSEGQLGAGEEALAPSSSVSNAIDLPSELPPATIAAGGVHSSALSSHGHVFVWGDGGCGQLGLPPPDSGPDAPPPRLGASTPQLLHSTCFEGRAQMEKKVPITVSAEEEGGRSFTVLGRRHPPLQVSSLSCGQYHTAACTVDGELFSWGANGDGQLGLGDTATRFTPYRVRMLAGRALEAPGEASCVQVACGGRHTLVLSAHGEVWSCGCNVHGQLGHGTSFGHSPLYQMKQVSAIADIAIVQIACGGAHSAAVSAEAVLYTWGKNLNGQLGHGHAQRQDEPIALSALERVAWVACGGAHTACLVRLIEGDVDDGASDASASARSTCRSAVGTSRTDAGGTSRSAAQPSGRSSIAPSARPTGRTERASSRFGTAREGGGWW